MPSKKKNKLKEKFLTKRRLFILVLVGIVGLGIGTSLKFLFQPQKPIKIANIELKSSHGNNVQKKSRLSKPQKSQLPNSSKPYKTAQKPIKSNLKVMEKTKLKSLDSITKKNFKNPNVSQAHKSITLSKQNKNQKQFVKKIAIVVDDMGLNQNLSAKVLRLKSPLTLSYLPYGKNLKQQTREAISYGHELLMHVPMEPINPNLDPGPNVLLSGIKKDELMKTILWNLNQFDNFVGVNNHMGSKFTTDPILMTVFFSVLKQKHLFFLDSLTIKNSIGEKIAKKVGIKFLKRNIFIDHIDDSNVIKKNLHRLEMISTARGKVIAICHPRKRTIRQLGPWLKTLNKRGFKLVPLSKLL